MYNHYNQLALISPQPLVKSSNEKHRKCHRLPGRYGNCTNKYSLEFLTSKFFTLHLYEKITIIIIVIQSL